MFTSTLLVPKSSPGGHFLPIYDARLATTTYSHIEPLNMAPAPTKAPQPFREQHTLRYGVSVVGRDEDTGAVTSVVCLFCRHFGREERPGMKRKPTNNFKYFRRPFRTDLYIQHHLTQHPMQWGRYRFASDEAKQKFFPTDRTRPEPDKEKFVDAKDVTEAAAAAKQSPVEKYCWFLIPKKIVDLVVPVAAVGVDRGWQPPTFRACQVVEVGDGEDDRQDDKVYRIALFARMELDVAVDSLATGLSPRQASLHLAALAKRTTGAGGEAPSFPLLSVEAMRDLARLTVSESLWRIGQLLAASWAFGLVLREVTAAPALAGAGYLDVRVVMCAQGKLCDVHVIALPLFERRTASALANAIGNVLDAVFPLWRARVLGITHNGHPASGDRSASDDPASAPAPSISPSAFRSAEVFDLLEKSILASSPTIPNRVAYKTWGACRQVSLALSVFYESVVGGGFIPVLRALIAYIRRNPKLLQEMGPPPSVAMSSLSSDTSGTVDLQEASAWMALGLNTQWITDKRVRLRKHLDQQLASLTESLSAPSSLSSSTAVVAPVDDIWWVAFFVVHWVATRVNEVFDELRLRRVSRVRQAKVISEMTTELMTTFTIQTQHEAAGNELPYLSRGGKFSIFKSNVRDFLDDQGIFVCNVISRVSSEALDAVLENLSTCLVNLAESLSDLSGTSDLESVDETPVLPPVLPHELVQLSGREFSSLLKQHGGQLRASLFDEELDTLEQEHQLLRRAASRDKELKTALAQCDSESSFAKTWALIRGKFPLLQSFAGGLASACAARDVDYKMSLAGLSLGVSTEDDTEDEALRIAVTDFVLEATLHAQQFDALAELSQSTP
ncbi:unnamed protein product [Phytophthora lilii]|uniref:Unnamed protein product n=1 Tax=Phytophthora lilii TaxID=2077276 RepID=A0A9W7D8U7_9STRA|nr:unnamed protein product [Phytophthora lilii]